jgi:hypothetical protein
METVLCLITHGIWAAKSMPSNFRESEGTPSTIIVWPEPPEKSLQWRDDGQLTPQHCWVSLAEKDALERSQSTKSSIEPAKRISLKN